MEKHKYDNPVIDIITFESNDVITTSTSYGYEEGNVSTRSLSMNTLFGNDANE